MIITEIVGPADADERAAIAEFVAILHRGGEYSHDLIARLPQGRVVVHVRGDAGHLAVIVIEDGVFNFHPLHAPDSEPQ